MTRSVRLYTKKAQVDMDQMKLVICLKQSRHIDLLLMNMAR
ncbi:hypothetical protein [Halobacillus shinanisalinarum]|nr:hypothetical protein [Halobacillus shinanisalinarum]